jgi:hypothetical protein
MSVGEAFHDELMAAGGPAFPSTVELSDGSGFVYSGMTLRDYFAAKALPSAFAQYIEYAEENGWHEGWRDGVARDAYSMADAMLKAREA